MCTILVVEDHLEVRESMIELVIAHGHTAHGAANGHEALVWLEAQSELPCLVFLDLHMPVMDGRAFLEALRQVAQWDHIVVIVMSAAVRHGAPIPALRAQAFWSKPPDLDQITNVHRLCLEHRESWQPPPCS